MEYDFTTVQTAGGLLLVEEIRGRRWYAETDDAMLTNAETGEKIPPHGTLPRTDP